MVSDFEAKTMENQLGAVEMIRNGPAILATRSRVIESSLYGKSTLPFEMPFFRSIDLNTFEDFQLAEIIARNL
jgi:CMP-N-acetylneuraminic acid synthetase